MKIEVIVLSIKQAAQTQKTLRVLNKRTKRMIRDLRDNRIDVADLQEYANSLTSAVKKLDGLLCEEEPVNQTSDLVLNSPGFEDVKPIINT